eukprot:TRINITY_DN3311_c0_g1_i3.p1 TRINITY_DN3311_c0_g1~~TRINITY_DN3311_c0_g1_i3.p1  ORF type:complete len:619 (+),score=142.77 TRINITY_DN3311_c0_g1_i3:34-1890(+)
MEMDISKRSEEEGIELPDVITHSFSKDQFLHKFKLILSESLGSQDIEDAWIGYFETIIEPCGWMAVWIPSNKTSEHYECPEGREGACVVEVHDVDPRNFVAQVEILKAPQQSVSIDEKEISVDVAELYPLSNQANSEFMNIKETAEALTLYRCFYKHIWRPWDVDENIPNWVQLHLAARLNLMMDHSSKTGQYSMAKRLQELASEAQRTKDEISELEETAVDVDDDEMDGVHAQLQQLAMRAHEITHEAKLLDDPIYGKLNYSALKAEKSRQRRENRTNMEPGILLVWKNGPLQEMATIMNTLCNKYPDMSTLSLHVVPSLQHAIDMTVAGDTVILSQTAGRHELTGGLNELGRGGGKIVGLECHVRPVIVPSETSDIMMLIDGEVDMKNVIVDATRIAKAGIVVRERGALSLNNVDIKNAEIGLRLQGNCKSSMSKCSIRNCSVAMVRSADTSVQTKEYGVYDCGEDVILEPEDSQDSDSVFIIKSVDLNTNFNNEKNVMREDFQKLTRLHRVSSSTPKSEAGPLDTAKANISMGSQTSYDSCSTVDGPQLSLGIAGGGGHAAFSRTSSCGSSLDEAAAMTADSRRTASLASSCSSMTKEDREAAEIEAVTNHGMEL